MTSVQWTKSLSVWKFNCTYLDSVVLCRVFCITAVTKATPYLPQTQPLTSQSWVTSTEEAPVQRRVLSLDTSLVEGLLLERGIVN